MTTGDERIARLEELGYTEREASFLVLAALHSGYFLRRQYREFLGMSPGHADATLAEKVVAKGHAQVRQAGLFRLHRPEAPEPTAARPAETQSQGASLK